MRNFLIYVCTRTELYNSLGWEESGGVEQTVKPLKSVVPHFLT